MSAAPTGKAAKGGRAGSRPRSGAAATHPRLSQLLVLTAMALALLLCLRLPAVVEAVVAGDQPAAPGGLTGAVPGDRAAAPLIEPAAGPEAPAAPSAAASATTDPMTVTAVQELAAELERREQVLSRREEALATQEAAMALVEQRLRQQGSELEALRASTTALVDQVAAEDEARAAQLARVYEAMKPRSAAAILEQLGLELVLPIVKGMRDAKVSAIVAAMSPDKARALTAELARKRTASLPK